MWMDVDSLIVSAKEVKNYLSPDGGSYMLEAGTCSASSPKIKAQEKVES